MKVVLRRNNYLWYVGLVIAFVLSCCMISLNNREARSIESFSYSWVNNEPTVVYSNDIQEIPQTGMCSSYLRSRQVVGQQGYKSVCVNEGNKLSYGTYFNGSANVAVIGFPKDKKMFALTTKKSVCNKTAGCLYVPEKDMLITKQYIINSQVRSLVIYKNFSKRITKTLGTPTVPTSYNFDMSNPDYTFQSSSNYAWPVEAVAASENGKWLVVEFKEKGIGVLNLETFEMRKIANTFLRYGGGLNPTAEMAINNDGSRVVVVGANAGMNIYESDGVCGVVADDARMTGNLRSNEECKKPFIYTDKFIDRFYAAYHPRLNENGAELRFYAVSYNGNKKEVSLRAAGYSPIQLEYLAMGDSFTSGEGETDDKHYLNWTNDEFERCHVSDRSYPLLLGSLYGMNPNLVKNVACSGAKTEDIVGNYEYKGQGDRLGKKGQNLIEPDRKINQSKALDDFIQGRVRQINFLTNYSPKAVSISIGGNDAGLMGKLKTCMMPGTCEWASTSTGKVRTASEIINLYDKLVDTYQTTIEASPSSKVYVVGYPKVIKKDGICNLLIGTMLDSAEREYMDESIKLLNEVVRSAAKRVGVKYVDIEDIMGEGRVCGSQSPPLINDVRLGDDFGINKFRFIGQETFHPRPEGHQLISQSIHSSIDNLSSRYCFDSQNLCADITSIAPQPSVYWTGGATMNNLYQQRSEEFISTSSDDYRNKNVELEDYTFEPGSEVTVEVHSDTVVLGTYAVSESGSVNLALNIPELVEDGYHTVHVYGKSYIGESIDVYQVIDLFDIPITDNNETPPAGGQKDPNNTGDPVDSDPLPVAEEPKKHEDGTDLTSEVVVVTDNYQDSKTNTGKAQEAVLSAIDHEKKDTASQQVLSTESAVVQEDESKRPINLWWYVLATLLLAAVGYSLTQLFRVVKPHEK